MYYVPMYDVRSMLFILFCAYAYELSHSVQLCILYIVTGTVSGTVPVHGNLLFSLLRLNLSVDTAVFLWTQPINFDCVFTSTSEHGFSFGYPPLAICVHPFLNVI